MKLWDRRVSFRTCLTILSLIIMAAWAAQSITLNYAYDLRTNQCNCQCVNNPNINRNAIHTKSNDEISSSYDNNKAINSKSKPQSEKSRNKALEEEDKALDKEIAANQSQKLKHMIEDPEEKDPYQPEEKLGGPDSRTVYENLVIAPLDINPKINASRLKCSKETANLLLIYVYTAPRNFEKRDKLRKTYGTVKLYNGIRLKLLFFVGGLLTANISQYNKLINESFYYGDLVQDRGYIDAYRNLTLKGISAIRWIASYCKHTYRVMKIDDDTMINPYNLVTFLKGQSDITMGEIICKVTQGVGPIRNPKSKYYVPESEYPDQYYPPYCQGNAYIFPPKILPKLVQTFAKNKLIAMEDVFITGITTKTAAIRLHPLTASYATTFRKFDVFLERITGRMELLVVGHVHDPRHVDLFWQLVTQREHTKQTDLKRAAALAEQKQEQPDADDHDKR